MVHELSYHATGAANVVVGDPLAGRAGRRAGLVGGILGDSGIRPPTSTGVPGPKGCRKMGPIVRRIDHVVINADDPAVLFGILTEKFGLPTAWPISRHGFYTSGGVALGDVHLEVIRFGRPVGSAAKTRFFGIAFEPVSLAGSLEGLARRRIPHGPPTSFRGGGGIGWTNVVVGGLAGRRSETATLGRFGGNSWLNRWFGSQVARLMRSRWADSLIGRMLVEPMIFVVAYGNQAGGSDGWRSGIAAEFEACRGGRLGVRCLDGIDIITMDFDGSCRRWQSLLDPVVATAPGVWRLDGSGEIRVVAGDSDRLGSISLRVASLERAAEELNAIGMLGARSEGRVSIDAGGLEGLVIWLV